MAQAASPSLQILLVEDEADIADPIAGVLSDEGHAVSVAYDGSGAMAHLRENAFDLLISDIRLPEVDGLALFQWVRTHAPSTAVILMSAYGSIPEAVWTLRQNAFHYLPKPFDVEELLRAVDQVAEQTLMRDWAPNGTAADDPIETMIIGQSPPMVSLKRRLATIAASDAPLLIQGETGTGKEVVAHAVHAASGRRGGPFVAINCGAFPETLIESELFGHERGAFTGADRRREGRFMSANGGTLFLDEISQMSPASQVRLLRVLQENQIQPLGSDRALEVDARILSATNVDLHDLVRRGEFREDLYYRLKVVDAHLPPLRARGDDIALLAGHFLRKHGSKADEAVRMTPCAWAFLRAYRFPGNVRELEHAIQHALILSRGAAIDLQHLPDEICGRGAGFETTDRPAPLAEAMERFERELIVRTLEYVKGSRVRAAELLGVSRKSVWEKIKRYGIPRGTGDERDR